MTKKRITTLEEAMEIDTKQYKQLNDKQKEIVDLILNKLDNNNNNHNNCFYIDGPGGAGKTFIYYNYLLFRIEEEL